MLRRIDINDQRAMRQLTFEDLTYLNRSRKTRRQRFLERMDRVLPWDTFLAILKPYYPKGARGRPPIPLETMLRIYFMQQWFDLSDPAAEDAVHDIFPIRMFAKVQPGYAPDETTICKFRHWLEEHGLTKQLLRVSRRHLEKHNILVREGTIVDATIIAAPSSTKNKECKRDPEMASTKKGNTWHFGMKAHVGTDTQGLVHSVETSAANVHDSEMMAACLHGEEEVIYGDKGYVSEARKTQVEACGVTWRVLRKATRKRKLDCTDQSFNRKSNRTRARVEHVFGVIKHQWGFRKVRYRGLEKNTAQLYTLFALANFRMVGDRLLALQG